MATNQEARQLSIRDSTSTTGTLNEDWHALFDDAGVAAGTFNERMLAWINVQLSASHTNLAAAMQAFAVDQGFSNWSSMGTITLAADAYAVGGFEPEFVADFAGVLNSGTEYYRSGGSDTTFSSVFTHSGLVLPATMTDSDGVLKWAPHNCCVNFSEWAITSETLTGGQADPDGGTGAYSLVAGGTSFEGTNATISSGNVDPGGDATFAVIAKNIDATWIRIRAFSNTDADCWFNLSTGAIGTTDSGISDSRITSLGDGWYLLEVDVADANQTTPTTSAIFLANADNTNNCNNGTGVYVYAPRVYRSNLGGMVNNPDRGDSYVPTTTAARFLPRRNNYIYNGTSWENAGILLEPAAATNLLLNSGTLSTQSVTVTAVAHTLHFTGTGTITLSGASTAGPLVGTGTGENNRVSLTFTPSAGSLTCTVSGTVTNAQLEVGSTATSYIPTSGSTVTRAAETLTAAGANLPLNTTSMSFHMDGSVNMPSDNNDRIWQIRGANSSLEIYTYIPTGTTTLRTDHDSGGAHLIQITSALSPSTGRAVFNHATRHTASEFNVALNGTAETANTAVTSMPDLTGGPGFYFGSVVGSLPNNGMTVALFRVWGTDIGDSGIEEASS